MNGKERAKKHNEDAKRYLEETAWRYPLNLQSGIHEPKSTHAIQSTQSRPDAEIDSHRPQANRAEIASAVISALGVFISLATLIGLVLTVAFSIKQWREANRSADASIVAAEASQVSASIAGKAITQSKNQFIQDERPWMFIDHVGQVMDSLQPYRIGGVIENVGRSPALNVQTSIKFAVQTSDTPPPVFRFSQREAGIKSPIGSQKNDSILLDRALTPVEVGRMDSAGWEAYLGIKIWYVDNWGNSYTMKSCQGYFRELKKWRILNPDNCKKNE